MTQKVQVLRSTVAGHVPGAGSMLPGELAVNFPDKKLFFGDAGGSAVDVGVAAAQLAVSGTPLTGFSTALSTAVSAADNLLAATGKLQAQINLLAPRLNPTLTNAVLAGNAVFSAANGTVAMGDSTIPNWGMFGGILQVGGKDGYNAIVGVASNNAPAGTAVFPTGVTGAARLSSAGSTAFGLFGRADQYTPGCATNEVNSFNYSAAASVSLPPDRSFGTTQTTPVALTVAAGGNFPSSVGVQICREGSAPQPFLTGLYINPDGASTYGILVDSDGTNGPGFPVYIKNKSTNPGLTIAPIGTATPGGASLQLKDTTGATAGVWRQNGTIETNGQVLVTDAGTSLQYQMSVAASSNPGGAVIRLAGNGTNGQKWLRARSGLLEFVNDSYTTVLASLDENGNFAVGQSGSVQILDAGTTPKNHILVSAANNTGGAQIQIQGNGAVTPKKYIRVQAGAFAILSDAGAAIATLTDAGALAVGDLTVNGTNSLAGAWTTTTGTVGSLSGALGSGNVGTIRYRKIGRTVDLNAVITMGSSGQGTGSGGLTLALPWTAAAGSALAGGEVTGSGKGLRVTITTGTSTLNIQNYDNSYPGANNYTFLINGTFEATA